MSYIPMGGNRPTPGYRTAKAGIEDYYWGVGFTGVAIAEQYKVSREDQDVFAYNAHMKALKAQEENRFKEQIVPIEVEHTFVNESGKKETTTYTISKDEGPRKDTNIPTLNKLRPVF